MIRGSKYIALCVGGALLACAQAVSAANVTYEYLLNFQGEAFEKAQVYEEIIVYDPDEEDYVRRTVWDYDYTQQSSTRLEGTDNVWGFAGPLSFLSPGDQISLSFTIDPTKYGGGGTYGLTECALGTYLCHGFDYWTPSPKNTIRYSSITGAEGGINGFSAADFAIDLTNAVTGTYEARFAYVKGQMFPDGSKRGRYIDYIAYFTLAQATLPDCSAFQGISTYDNVDPVCSSTNQQNPNLPKTPLPASAFLVLSAMAGFWTLSRRRRHQA